MDVCSNDVVDRGASRRSEKEGCDLLDREPERRGCCGEVGGSIESRPKTCQTMLLHSRLSQSVVTYTSSNLG